MTYQQLKNELAQNYPMVSPYHYWIISSSLTYPSMSVYADESTRIFDNDPEPDMKRFNDISFENCKVCQCDGRGNSDDEHNLSEFVVLKDITTKTYKIKFVFDCTQHGSIYRTITCSEDNFSNAYKHELMLAKIKLNLHYDEPSIMLSKEEI